jgi:hypothetical protein
MIARREGEVRLDCVAQPKTTQSGEFGIEANRQFLTNAVGESRYQQYLAGICGPRKREGEKKLVDAKLYFEDGNKVVRVDIDALTVGYLSRDDAREWRRAVLAQWPKVAHLEYVTCKALIVGG